MGTCPPWCRTHDVLAGRGELAYLSPTMPTRLVLYQRDYCHLCDQALAVMAEARAPDFDSVWVDDDASLEARYGERVPVLRDDRDGRELDWPFDAAAVQNFLSGAIGDDSA